jgi:hypothetical protein
LFFQLAAFLLPGCVDRTLLSKSCLAFALLPFSISGSENPAFMPAFWQTPENLLP